MDSNSILMIIGGLALLGIVASSSKKSKKKTTKPTPVPTTSWSIGPVFNGENYSKGMPEKPTPQGGGWMINFPNVNGEVDAVINHNPPSLAGAKAIEISYTVTGDGFLASEENNVPGRVGVYVQRKGDNWSGTGKYQQYRLYGQSRPLLTAGDGKVSATVWTDVGGKVVNQDVVDGVFADLDNVAVCFGGSFASHGVYATTPATFTMLEFVVVR